MQGEVDGSGDKLSKQQSLMEAELQMLRKNQLDTEGKLRDLTINLNREIEDSMDKFKE